MNLIDLKDTFYSNDFIDYIKSHQIVFGLDDRNKVNDAIYLDLVQNNMEFFSVKDFGCFFAEYTVEHLRAFFLRWSKPWRTSFLQNDLSDKELELIIKGNLIVQANDIIELGLKYSETKEKLGLVNPPVDLTLRGINNEEGHFISIKEIKTAFNNGLLKLINPDLITIDSLIINKYGHAVVEELSNLITSVLQKLKTEKPHLHSIIELASGTRDLETQKLLAKLGYPAAQLSYHTCGKAIDFRLNENSKIEWNEYLLSVKGFIQIDNLISVGIQPTIYNLVRYNVINSNNIIVELDNYLSSIEGIFRLDESPFFRISNPNTGNTLRHNPLWHLQLTE